MKYLAKAYRQRVILVLALVTREDLSAIDSSKLLL